MTLLSTIQERLQQTDAALDHVQRTLTSAPNSKALALEIKALTKRRNELRVAFSGAARELGYDVLGYRIFGDADERMSIRGLTQVLGNFQTLLTVIYDSLKTNRPRNNVNVNIESTLESTLQFGYSFSGSLGIALIAKNRELWGPGTHLDAAVTTIFDMAHLRESAEIRDYANTLGSAPIQVMHDWAESHARSNTGAEVRWGRGVETRQRLLAQRPELEHLYLVIEQTSDETVNELTLDGELRGVDMEGAFRFLHQNVSLTGRVMPGVVSESHRAEIPARYRVRIRKVSTLTYATGEQKDEYYLLHIGTRSQDNYPEEEQAARF